MEWKKEAQEECHCRAQARHELQGWQQEQKEKRKKKAARTATRERKKELKAVEALLRQHKSKPSGTQGRAAGEPPKKRARLEAKKTMAKRKRKPILKTRNTKVGSSTLRQQNHLLPHDRTQRLAS